MSTIITSACAAAATGVAAHRSARAWARSGRCSSVKRHRRAPARLAPSPEPPPSSTDRYRQSVGQGRSSTAASASSARLRWPTWAGMVMLAIVGRAAPLPAALAAAWLASGPWRERRRDERRRVRQVVDAMPDVIDLLRVAAAAGATPANAIDAIAGLAPLAAAGALEQLVSRIGSGERFAEATRSLVDLLGEPARPLADALRASDQGGMALGPALEIVGLQARTARRHAVEVAVRRLPVQLCFPLAACMLPAFVLLTVAPLLAGALRSLRL